VKKNYATILFYILTLFLILFWFSCSDEIKKDSLYSQKNETEITTTTINSTDITTTTLNTWTTTIKTTIKIIDTSTTTTTIINNNNLKISINLITPEDVKIDFGNYNGTLNKNIGEILNITASFLERSTFEWYLNGISLGITDNNCSIKSNDYSPGVYSLTVIALKDGLYHSGTIQIKIIN